MTVCAHVRVRQLRFVAFLATDVPKTETELAKRDANRARLLTEVLQWAEETVSDRVVVSSACLRCDRMSGHLRFLHPPRPAENSKYR